MDNLNPTTPYMLRKDGTLLECGDVHPYIKAYFEYDDDKNIEELDDLELQWFYDNSLDQKIKDNVVEFRKTGSKESFNKLNELTNNEFCRVRTSNHKYKYGGDNGEIYFRLSNNDDFNWFDNIWDTVIIFKDNIKDVTIMKDYQTFGKQFDYCKIKGKEIKHIPVEEFLVIEGNPILEGENMEKELLKSEQIENFIEDLYDLRKDSIAKDGEYGLGNLVFKEFRNLGYLDNLKELRKEYKGKELSLEQLDNKF